MVCISDSDRPEGSTEGGIAQAKFVTRKKGGENATSNEREELSGCGVSGV